MEMLTSRLLLLEADEPIEKEMLSQTPPSPASIMFSSANRSPPQRHSSTLCTCVCVCTDTHSAEEEEKEEEEEVPEGGECGVLVCFLFELLLQYRLFFHWLLCGPAGFSVVRNRAWLINVNTEGRHSADRFCLVLL